MNRAKAIAIACVLAVVSLFSFRAAYSAFRMRRCKQLLQKRQAKQAPKFQCRCEAIIYFNHSGLRIDTVSLLEHEKEYYEELRKE